MATDFDALFQQAGQRFNVDPALLRAVSGAESGGNFDIQDSPAGAFGGIQIMPATYQAVAKQYGLTGDPRDPANNIAAGAAVLSENLGRYGNVPDALRAYNGGTDPSKWGNPEATAYVGRVARFYQPNPSQPADAAAPSRSPPGSYQVAAKDTGTRSVEGRHATRGVVPAGWLRLQVERRRKPDRTQVTVMLDPQVAERLRFAAELARKSVAALIEESLAATLVAAGMRPEKPTPRRLTRFDAEGSPSMPPFLPTWSDVTASENGDLFEGRV